MLTRTSTNAVTTAIPGTCRCRRRVRHLADCQDRVHERGDEEADRELARLVPEDPLTIRGENWPIASWTTTIVIVSTSAARDTIEAATVARIAVAASGPPTKHSGSPDSRSSGRGRSSRTTARRRARTGPARAKHSPRRAGQTSRSSIDLPRAERAATTGFPAVARRLHARRPGWSLAFPVWTARETKYPDR